MKTIRGILVDTENGITPTKLEYNDYKDIANLLKCEWITCVQRIINGYIVDIYCDEEALLKDAREPSIFTKDNNKIIEVLYGNCFICLHNKNGEIKSLPYAKYDTILLAQATIKYLGKYYQCLQCTLR